MECGQIYRCITRAFPLVYNEYSQELQSYLSSHTRDMSMSGERVTSSVLKSSMLQRFVDNTPQSDIIRL